jgi:elongation factor P
MIISTDLKNGTTFLYEGKPYRILKYSHQKIGRGGATVKVTARNLISGNQEDKTFPPSAKFEEIATSKKNLQYLYSDANDAFFMNPISFDQITISLDILAGDLNFLKEGEYVDVHFWDDRPLSVDLPSKVVLKVVDTPPGVKGNSATNIYKPATAENGLKLKVPLFIKNGDKIRVDTRTGAYVERAN